MIKSNEKNTFSFVDCWVEELRADGGIISGAKAAGGSMPLNFRWTIHIAKANWSQDSLPLLSQSQSPLIEKFEIWVHNIVKVQIKLRISYHIWAKRGWGNPDCKNVSLISIPDTNPSMSTSALMNKVSYCCFSAADTTHGLVAWKKIKWINK